MFVQTTNVGKQAHIQLKDRERDQLLGQERDQLVRSTMDKLKGQHADLMQAMTIFGKDIDDKMKDIRSLLLGKEVHNYCRREFSINSCLANSLLCDGSLDN